MLSFHGALLDGRMHFAEPWLSEQWYHLLPCSHQQLIAVTWRCQRTGTWGSVSSVVCSQLRRLRSSVQPQYFKAYNKRTVQRYGKKKWACLDVSYYRYRKQVRNDHYSLKIKHCLNMARAMLEEDVCRISYVWFLCTKTLILAAIAGISQHEVLGEKWGKSNR